MKRPGKPDTGNPFVRFDEGRSGDAALTTAVSSIRLPPLRLLYQQHVRFEVPTRQQETLAETSNRLNHARYRAPTVCINPRRSRRLKLLFLSGANS